MEGPIEGRWLVDFGTDDSAGAANEVVLGAGIVALAIDGKAIGRYEVKPGELTMTLPMPAFGKDGEWLMTARFALPRDLGTHAYLIGIMHGVVPGEETFAHSCTLRRMRSQA